MSEHTLRATRRELRKIVGSRATATVIDTAYDFQMFRRMSFWRRFAWLFFGR